MAPAGSRGKTKDADEVSPCRQPEFFIFPGLNPGIGWLDFGASSQSEAFSMQMH